MKKQVKGFSRLYAFALPFNVVMFGMSYPARFTLRILCLILAAEESLGVGATSKCMRPPNNQK